jgi:hypothetical protein
MLWNRILGESGKLPLKFKTSYVQGNFSRLHTNQRKWYLWELIHYSESTVSRRSSWILDTQNGSVTYKDAAEWNDSVPTNQPQNSSGHQIQNNVSPYIIEQMENVPNTDKNLTKLNTLSYGLKSKGIIIGLMVVGANRKHSIKGCQPFGHQTATFIYALKVFSLYNLTHKKKWILCWMNGHGFWVMLTFSFCHGYLNSIPQLWWFILCRYGWDFRIFAFPSSTPVS